MPTTDPEVNTHALNATSYNAIATEYFNSTQQNRKSWVKQVLKSTSGTFQSTSPTSTSRTDPSSTTKSTSSQPTQQTSNSSSSSPPTRTPLKPNDELPLNPRPFFLHHLTPLLSPSLTDRALDLGCGAGTFSLPILINACQQGYVLGVDGSSAMIEMAGDLLRELGGQQAQGKDGTEGKDGDAHKHKHKDQGEDEQQDKSLKHAEVQVNDMTHLTLPASSFNAIVSFYAFIHLPREEQRDMLRKVWTWLSSSETNDAKGPATGPGYVLLNLTARDTPGSQETNWLGSEEGKMYWDGHDAEGNVKMVEEAGFEVMEAVVIDDEEEEGKIVPFLWVLARKKERP